VEACLEALPERPSAARAPLSVEEIYRRYAPRVQRLVRRLLGNEADAEDATQEVFVHVLERLPTFRGECAFPTWLYRVALNTALAYRRRRAIRETCPLPEGLADVVQTTRHGGRRHHEATGPVRELLRHEAQQRVDAAIASLPPAYREVVERADLEERPCEDVARELGLSLAAVRNRLRRARGLLRARLRVEFAPEPS
jgi:RNA polymerase sigma-70 factor (ECF subfamily)